MIASDTAIASTPTSSGSAAATSAPKASTRMIRVSGSSRFSPSALSRGTTVRTSRSSGARPVTRARYLAPSGSRATVAWTSCRAPASPARPRCRRASLPAPRSRRSSAGRGSGTWCRRWTGRRPGRGCRAGGRAWRAGCRGPPEAPASSNEAGASKVTAKNSPIGRLKRWVSRSSVRDASVGRSLPPRMLSKAASLVPGRPPPPRSLPRLPAPPSASAPAPGQIGPSGSELPPRAPGRSKWQNVRRLGVPAPAGAPLAAGAE